MGVPGSARVGAILPLVAAVALAVLGGRGQFEGARLKRGTESGCYSRYETTMAAAQESLGNRFLIAGAHAESESDAVRYVLSMWGVHYSYIDR